MKLPFARIANRQASRRLWALSFALLTAAVASLAAARSAGPLAEQRPESPVRTGFHSRAPWQTPDLTGEGGVQLCQHLTPASPNPTPAIDCNNSDACCTQRGWQALGPVPDFQEYSQGE